MNRNEFGAGIRAGIPVCLGYFSVSFGFGATAIAEGLDLWQAILISFSNLTSAGQFAGLTVIAAGATIFELVLTLLVINSRYSLMSLALSQKLGPGVGFAKRLVAAFFNTDEIFALGMAMEGKLSVSYFVGAGTIAALGWTAGTTVGAIAGSLLPESIQATLSAMLYGMFIAIVIPQAKQDKPMLICLVLSLVFSCLFRWIPFLSFLSPGLVIVICTVAVAAICALLFPIADEEGDT